MSANEPQIDSPTITATCARCGWTWQGDEAADANEAIREHCETGHADEQ